MEWVDSRHGNKKDKGRSKITLVKQGKNDMEIKEDIKTIISNRVEWYRKKI